MNGKARNKPKHLTRIGFENELSKHKRTFKEIKDLHRKEVITDFDYFYTASDVAKIAEYAAKAAWKDCLLHTRNNSRWLWEKIIDICKDAIQNPFK